MNCMKLINDIENIINEIGKISLPNTPLTYPNLFQNIKNKSSPEEKSNSRQIKLSNDSLSIKKSNFKACPK
jgi:hypothetical protein